MKDKMEFDISWKVKAIHLRTLKGSQKCGANVAHVPVDNIVESSSTHKNTFCSGKIHGVMNGGKHKHKLCFEPF